MLNLLLEKRKEGHPGKEFTRVALSFKCLSLYFLRKQLSVVQVVALRFRQGTALPWP